MSVQVPRCDHSEPIPPQAVDTPVLEPPRDGNFDVVTVALAKFIKEKNHHEYDMVSRFRTMVQEELGRNAALHQADTHHAIQAPSTGMLPRLPFRSSKWKSLT